MATPLTFRLSFRGESGFRLEQGCSFALQQQHQQQQKSWKWCVLGNKPKYENKKKKVCKFFEVTH